MDNNSFSKMAQFITTLRKEKGLTQKELADKLGVTDKAVSKWERGLNCPDIALLTDLARILRVTTNELLNGERAALPAPEVDAVVESTLRYADSSTQDIRSRGKRWKALAIAAVALLVCVLVYIAGQRAIESAAGWSVFPTNLIISIWLLALAGIFILGKNKIATLILCSFLVYFTTTLFARLNRNSLLYNFTVAVPQGSRTPFIPHYAVIIALLTLSLVVMVMVLRIRKKTVSTDIVVLLIGLGLTTLILSPLTVSAIMDYVDLNGLGVDPRYPVLLLPTGLMTVVSLAMLGKRQFQKNAAKKESN